MVLMMLLLILVIGMVAFAVDVGLMVLLRAEIQNSVDAGALAAGLTLQKGPGAIGDAQDAARRLIQANRVGMTRVIAENAIEVEAGVFDDATKTFTVTTQSPNAVRVFAHQDDQPFFFARIFGQTTFGAPAEAIATCTSQPLDIMMVLDLTGSMGSEGRIEALRHSAPVFVNIIELAKGNDHIGVMCFTANPDTYDPTASGDRGVLYASGLHPTSDHGVGVLEAALTDDFAYLKNTVLSESNLEDGKYSGGTGIGSAIGDAAHYLTHGAEARDESRKVIVLMSDGEANRPTGNGASYARDMARYAAGLGVTVYTISLGNDADVYLMQQIADIARGEHLDATGSGEAMLTSQLTAAFTRAASAIKRVQLVK